MLVFAAPGVESGPRDPATAATAVTAATAIPPFHEFAFFNSAAVAPRHANAKRVAGEISPLVNKAVMGRSRPCAIVFHARENARKGCAPGLFIKS
jgi:hypothetical protein